MSSVIPNDLNLAATLAGSQFQRALGHLKAAETEIPTSDHAHRGNDNVYLLTRENMNFQMLDSSNNITFITGHDDDATFVGGGAQKIYDNGTGVSVILHGQSPGAVVQIVGADHDSRFQLYLHDFADHSIKPDGHGGTLISGQIDLVNSTIPASKIHFISDPAWVPAASTGQYPTPPHAEYG